MEETSYSTLKRPHGVATAFLFLSLAATFSACSTETDVGKPSQARILVDGTAAESMELITATDFIEMVDQSDQTTEYVLLDSDTVMIDLAYDQTVDIVTLGSIFFQLKYEPVEPANIRMRVWLDDELQIDQPATMSEGAALIYSFIYLSTGF